VATKARTPKATPPAKAARKTVKPAKRAVKRAGAEAAPPERGPRRAVFIDVENTSSEAELTGVLDQLGIERANGTTEITAIGNWRVVGQGLGRALAARGAQLLHSAPATRVPDWSDLWIAVTAGIWLGRAAPGDTIEIVSHDRAFDAVGDAAARLGVRFRRITYRERPAAAAGRETGAAAAELEAGRGRRRRRRGGRRHRAAEAAPPAPPAPAPVTTAAGEEEPHGASHEQVRLAIARLTAVDPARGVGLDALSNALKAAGFQRPPGSPRLVTRLRRMKDVELLPSGRVRLIEPPAGAAAAPAAPGVPPPASQEAPASAPAAAGDLPAEPVKRRPRRRGGRGGRGRKKAAAGSGAAIS
jgi:hypothetical protein